jgi:ABC-type uncharacterized transport system substrate-binding protein
MKFLLYFVVFGSYCFAHPHVFAYTKFDISIEKNILQATLSWSFDDMTSQLMLMDYDTNKNNAIDPNELKILKKEAFDQLKEFHYYTFAYQGNKPLPLSEPKNFQCFVSGKSIVYKFKVTTTFDVSKNNLKIGSFDTDNLTAFQIDTKSKIILQNKSLQNLSLKYIIEDNDYYAAEMLLLNWKGTK